MWQGDDFDFDPNGPGLANGNLFGLPKRRQESELIVIPVPWEVTVSYRAGTSQAPLAILEASTQVDLFHPLYPECWKFGMYLLAVHEPILQLNIHHRQKAMTILQAIERGKTLPDMNKVLSQINQGCEQMVNWVKEQAMDICKEKKTPCVLGGDHSTSLGLIQALSEQHDSFGILQIDAHADLRHAYEGFQFSHASIMYNALQLPEIETLVQVGVRDVCEEEVWRSKEDERIHMFTQQRIRGEQFQGVNWNEQVSRIISLLPEKVYISFDIDGLDPCLCPHTGTPVPDGLQFEEAMFLVDELVSAGREVIGFDLVEVGMGQDDWDANVGARVLYRLFAASVYSRS